MSYFAQKNVGYMSESGFKGCFLHTILRDRAHSHILRIYTSSITSPDTKGFFPNHNRREHLLLPVSCRLGDDVFCFLFLVADRVLGYFLDQLSVFRAVFLAFWSTRGVPREIGV